MFKTLLGNPWTLVAIAVVAFSAGFYTSHQFGKAAQVEAIKSAVAAEQKQYAQRDTKHTQEQKADQDLGSQFAALRDQLGETQRNLQAAIAGKQLVLREAPTHENPCPDPRRAPSYRMCFNAAISGDGAAIATCQAGGGHASVQGESLPVAGVVR